MPEKISSRGVAPSETLAGAPPEREQRAEASGQLFKEHLIYAKLRRHETAHRDFYAGDICDAGRARRELHYA
jgi:hypothetical protein